MAKGFKHGAGGANPLNFQVVGNPQPSTAKENTIWVDTDRINNYYFSATQPENMAEYDVWFPTGTSSTVAFSATKKNPIMVYPLSAKQYVSGAWVDKTAKSYQGGKWVDWVTVLFDGSNYASLWEKDTSLYMDNTKYKNVGAVSIGNTIVLTNTTDSAIACATLVDSTDLTGKSKIVVDVSLLASYKDRIFIIKDGTKNVGSPVAEMELKNGENTFPINLSGAYIIGVYNSGITQSTFGRMEVKSVKIM